MTMTVFSWLFWRNIKFGATVGGIRVLFLALSCLLAGPAAADSPLPEITTLQLERQPEGVFLAATVQFDLPAAVEDALQKGLPVVFVAEVDAYQSRWYWYAKRVLSAQRHLRLAFQPLTRRWRVSTSTGTFTSTGLGFALHQNYDSLDEAVAAIRRFSRWKIAEGSELEKEKNHYVEFRFRLDITQLPRPFQIGALGQSDWNLAATAVRQLPASESR